MTELELNKEYSYTNLEKWFGELINIDPNATWDENGPFEVGKTFITISCTITYSFIMTGYNDNNGAIYKLIYKE